MNIERESGHPSFYLQGGQVRYPGLRGVFGQLQRLSLTARLTLALVLLNALGLLPQLRAFQGTTGLTIQMGILVSVSGLVVLWFHHRIASAIDDAKRFADAMAGCNLTTTVAGNYPPPLDGLFRSMRQIQINLQAVVGDVRSSIEGFTHAASEIAAGGIDLSARTESQASSLQQTAAPMEQISSNGQHTAQTANQVFMQSKDSNVLATQGGESVHKAADLR